jgi:hypothetical protein
VPLQPEELSHENVPPSKIVPDNSYPVAPVLV